MGCIECGSAAATERPERTAQGYRRFRCRACGKQWNERSGTVMNRAQYPSDVIALVVLWPLRCKLSLRDLPEMFALRGTVFSYEAMREWEAITPALAEELRRCRRGKAGLGGHVDETFIKVDGRWCYVYRAIDSTGALVDVLFSERRYMKASVRNLCRAGATAAAISAVDAALWDLKAKLLDLPLAALLGRYRDDVPIYGSGGFTTYDDARLADQFAGWVERDGCRAVKMKIGTDPARDPARVRAAKAAIGDAALFVDANGAYGVKQALHLARVFASEADVRWFEEPVSSDDLAGLRRVRDHVPSPMEVAAGEYGYELDYFRAMLAAGAVDVQQADATRCGGVTGFLQAAALCEAFHIDLSAHCAPALHRHLGCAAPRFRHCEWFHDHAHIEQMLFDGAPVPRDGRIAPDMTRPGFGLIFKRQDAERFAVGPGSHA